MLVRPKTVEIQPRFSDAKMTQDTSPIASPPSARAPLVEQIAVRGLFSVRKVEIEIAPVNLLIGANGSGKTSFISAFQLLRAIRSGRLQDTVMGNGGAGRLLHFGPKITREISFEIWFWQEGDFFNGYEITLKPTSQDSLYVSSEFVQLWNKSKYPEPRRGRLSPSGAEAIIADPNQVPNFVDDIAVNPWIDRGTARHVARGLDSFRLYHFHDTGFHSPMKKTTETRLDRSLNPDGSNLAAFLYRLREEYPQSYGMIKHVVWLAAPFFRDFHLEPRGEDGKFILLEWLHTGSDSVWDASALSDGTLRFMALAALLLQPKELIMPTILLDEPELGLHPQAITLLANMVQRASAHSRIILATQSPRLVDEFQPEQVIVANRVDGATELTRLNADDLAAWLSDYSLGDLWEMNEFGGNRAKEGALR